MAFDLDTADRVRIALADQPDLTERQMFGGLAFMVGGKMACGIIGDELMIRLGPEGAEAAIAEDPQARPMDFTGRPMRGYVYLAPAGFADDAVLQSWVDRAVEWTRTL